MVELGDTSWDVAQIQVGDIGLIARRSRPEHRGEERKVLISSLRREQDQLHDILGRMGNFIVENTRAMDAMKNTTAENTRAMDVMKNTAAENTRAMDAMKNTTAENMRAMDAMKNTAAENTHAMAAMKNTTAENTRAMEAMKRENAESMLKVDQKLQFLFENEDRLIAGAQSALDKQEMVEIHEALSMCLQGYNDIIFNINRPPRRAGELVLTWGMKQELKADGFHYITQLFCPPRNLLPLSPEADSRRRQALRILTPQEESLCADMVGRLLGGREERNTEQHPKPDRETTLHRLRDLDEAHHGLLRYYLAGNPQRIPGRKEPLGVDLSIFPSDGTYVSAAQGRIELERRKAKRAELEMTL